MSVRECIVAGPRRVCLNPRGVGRGRGHGAAGVAQTVRTGRASRCVARCLSAGLTRLTRRGFIGVLVLCGGVVLAMGTAGAEWQNFRVRDGLAGDGVHAILEDRGGNLWFASYGGVSCYDGVSWRTYTTADGLAGDYVVAIEEDRDGNLWFGTRGYGVQASGVSRYDGVGWRTYTTADGLAGNDVLTIEEDASGNLWFGTVGGGVSRYDGGGWRTYTTADGLASNDVAAILQDRRGNLWFGTYNNGVSRYDGTGWRTYTMADGLVSNTILAIEEDASGNLWFGGNGLCRYDGVSWRKFMDVGGPVCAIMEDSNGSLWFGTSAGVYRYDGVSWRTYTEGGYGILAIEEDASGNLWFGTAETGASRFDGASWHTYTTVTGLADQSVVAIEEDRSGNLWFGTAGGGVTRYDGVSWRTFTTSHGLADNGVEAIEEDSNGSIWFGTYGSGASRYDGWDWFTYTVADGLAGNHVTAILEDRARNIWFGTAGNGVSRYDNETWRTYTTADGLAGDHITAILEDRAGNIWFGTGYGVSRYDGIGWRTFTTADGLASDAVSSILEDSAGNFWFGTYNGGACRYDGTSWRTFTVADGLASNSISQIVEDSSGNLWFGTYDNLTRYDGTSWGTYVAADGLPETSPGEVFITALSEDRAGDLWIGADIAGITRHERDRVAPQAVMWQRPVRISANTIQTIRFTAAFGEIRWTQFSYSFDGSPWSDWSMTNSWYGSNLSDGVHVFKVRARDKIGNVDPTPATCEFELDATPPVPAVSTPASGQAVRDSVLIAGTAADSRFRSYRVDVRALGHAEWDSLFESFSPVAEGVLCGWNTLTAHEGSYELRLSVTDTLGLTGVALVRVTVDNEAPWAYETAPATVSTVRGGGVYTTDAKAHVYFPPHAFDEDTEVGIFGLLDSDVPDTLADGARRALAGYEVSWGGSVLEKAATLELSLDGAGSLGTGERFVLYLLGSGSSWQRLGGTVDAAGEHVTSSLTKPGRYAVFVEGIQLPGTSALTSLSLTPRAFSPRGRFANDHVGIAFTLGSSSSVTVRVYNRAGRLVREVMSGEVMGAGANLVRWDGRDVAGEIVGEGLYIVSVEALGNKQAKTVSVVR